MDSFRLDGLVESDFRFWVIFVVGLLLIVANCKLFFNHEFFALLDIYLHFHEGTFLIDGLKCINEFFKEKMIASNAVVTEILVALKYSSSFW